MYPAPRKIVAGAVAEVVDAAVAVGHAIETFV